MKEIKFRAWDKEDNKMVYSDEVFPKSRYKFEFDCFSDYKFKLMKMVDRYNVVDDKGNETYQEVFLPIDADIMQYTGMKDSNGKDIYEGDIVEYFKDELSQIKLQRGGFVVESETRFDTFFEIAGGIKVVGNIHEGI